MGRGKKKGKDPIKSNPKAKEAAAVLVAEKKDVAEETEKAIRSLSEAAANIDLSALKAHLAYEETMPDIGLYSLYFYLEKEVFPQVSSQWLNVLKESRSSDVPLSYIPKRVCDCTVDWIKKLQTKTHPNFVMWVLDCLLADWEAKDTSSKTQMARVVALAMVLRGKPETLTFMLPMLRERPRYQGEEKLPVMVWIMDQAYKGDICTGLYSWSRNLLPLMVNNNNPESLDLILRYVEKILSKPKAKSILVDGADRNGEQLISPCAFEMLVRLTFPASSDRVEIKQATKRFENIYNSLKGVALEGGSKAVKEIFAFSLKLAGEGDPDLAKEARAIAIRCMKENVDCFKKWDILYKEENIEASVGLLKKLVDEWEDHSVKLLSSPSHTRTVKHAIDSFMMKNERAITEGVARYVELYEEADKSCKLISGYLGYSYNASRASDDGFDVAPFTAMVIAAAAALVGAAVTLLNMF